MTPARLSVLFTYTVCCLWNLILSPWEIFHFTFCSQIQTHLDQSAVLTTFLRCEAKQCLICKICIYIYVQIKEFLFNFSFLLTCLEHFTTEPCLWLLYSGLKKNLTMINVFYKWIIPRFMCSLLPVRNTQEFKSTWPVW